MEPLSAVRPRFTLPPSTKGRQSIPFYLEDLDSADLGRINRWCLEGKGSVIPLPHLGGAVVSVRADEKEEFLRNIGEFPSKLHVTRGRKIAYQSLIEMARDKVQRLSNAPLNDHVLQILNMNRVHHGPLGNFTGKGETICVVDSGIFPSHPDFQDESGRSRLKYFVDFVEGKEGLQYANDRWGHGTHMCGDAAGTGKASGGLFGRLAPDAELVVLKVEEETDVLKALDWILANKEKFGIGVVSLSIGLPAQGSYKTDPLARGVDKLIQAGIFVTAAAGNDPERKSINTPGIHPDVVTATTLDTHHQKNIKRFTISPSASTGPLPYDPGVAKPNLALPGVDIYGPLAPNSLLDPKETSITPFGRYFPLSGSSTPCQMAAGMIACIHQALRERGLSITPGELLRVLEETAHPLRDPATGKKIDHAIEGAGVPNGYRALEKALEVASNPHNP